MHAALTEAITTSGLYSLSAVTRLFLTQLCDQLKLPEQGMSKKKKTHSILGKNAILLWMQKQTTTTTKAEAQGESWRIHGRTGACPDASVKSHATLGRYQHSEMSQDVKAVFECASLTCQGFGWQSGTRDRTARSPGEDEG